MERERERQKIVRNSDRREIEKESEKERVLTIEYIIWKRERGKERER